MKTTLLLFISICIFFKTNAQIKWKEVTSEYAITNKSVKVFESEGNYNDSAFRAFYVQINTKDKSLNLGMDTTVKRRITPLQFNARLNNPLVVVNASFFEFSNNTNVNVIVKDGNTVAYNMHNIPGKGKRDTLTYLHILGGAIGMTKSGKLDIGYTYTDSSLAKVYFQSEPLIPFRDSSATLVLSNPNLKNLKPWNVKWAVGGGPVLIRDAQIHITNEEERKFSGKAINDRHPRTAMGYTKSGDLIIMAIQGRMKGIAVGTTLGETAALLLELGCYEAINLDGGGSSCMLVNGKETIKPSDPTGERPVPAVFYVKQP